MNVTLGDKREDDPPKKSQDFNLTKEQLELYIVRHQNYVQLSSGETRLSRNRQDWAWFSNANPVAARKVEYWQRLFELEEDIPAHPETPEQLLGVQPW